MNKYNFYPIITVVSIVSVLTILTFFYPSTQQSYFFKKIDLFADLKNKPVLKKTSNIKLIKLKLDSSLNANIDKVSVVEDADGNICNFASLFAKIKQKLNDKKKIRIAYFGDSMIEGDLITQDIRDALQKKFGGSGVGFVPIMSPVAGFRQSIIHSFSDNWQSYNFLKIDTSFQRRPGMSGSVFFPLEMTQTGDYSWVKYSASSFRQKWASFKNCMLYYGKTSGSNFCFIEKDAAIEKIELNGTAALNILPIATNNTFSSIKLNFNGTQTLPVYGVSFEGDTGVVLDNFSFRGNSGLTLTAIPYKHLQIVADKLDYDLIILHYGLNVASTTMKDYTWYQKGMERVVSYLKNCFPKAEVLIVSVSDKSCKNDLGNFETDPAIPLLVSAQYKVAQTTNSSFYNLYKAMGGYNSMVKWVEADTALANKDYTHVNFAGSRKIASYITQFLLSNYEKQKYASANNKVSVEASVILKK